MNPIPNLNKNKAMADADWAVSVLDSGNAFVAIDALTSTFTSP